MTTISINLKIHDISCYQNVKVTHQAELWQDLNQLLKVNILHGLSMKRVYLVDSRMDLTAGRADSMILSLVRGSIRTIERFR